MSKDFGLYLTQERIIARWQLANAVRLLESYPDSLGDNLVRLGYLEEQQYLDIVSKFYGVDIVSSVRFSRVPASASLLVPRDMAAIYRAMPLEATRTTLTVAFLPPLRKEMLRSLQLYSGLKVEAVLTLRDPFLIAYAKCYSLRAASLSLEASVRDDLKKLYSPHAGQGVQTSSDAEASPAAPRKTPGAVRRRDESRLKTMAQDVETALADADDAIDLRVDASPAAPARKDTPPSKVPVSADDRKLPLREAPVVAAPDLQPSGPSDANMVPNPADVTASANEQDAGPGNWNDTEMDAAVDNAFVGGTSFELESTAEAAARIATEQPSATPEQIDLPRDDTQPEEVDAAEAPVEARKYSQAQQAAPEPVVVEPPAPEPVAVEPPAPEPVVVEPPAPEPVAVEPPAPESVESAPESVESSPEPVESAPESVESSPEPVESAPAESEPAVLANPPEAPTNNVVPTVESAPAAEPSVSPPSPSAGPSGAPEALAVAWDDDADRLNAALADASNRNEIIEITLDFLHHKAPRCLFFSVKKDRADGFSSRGLAVDAKTVKGLSLDLVMFGVFRAAVRDQAPFVGDPHEDELVAQLGDMLGGRTGRIAIIPISIKEKPVGFMYCDDGGTGGGLSIDHAMATSVMKLVSAAFQTLILARKLGF